MARLAAYGVGVEDRRSNVLAGKTADIQRIEINEPFAAIAINHFFRDILRGPREIGGARSAVETSRSESRDKLMGRKPELQRRAQHK